VRNEKKLALAIIVLIMGKKGPGKKRRYYSIVAGRGRKSNYVLKCTQREEEESTSWALNRKRTPNQRDLG
jgi:hypothetical protein